MIKGMRNKNVGENMFLLHVPRIPQHKDSVPMSKGQKVCSVALAQTDTKVVKTGDTF